MAQTDENDSAMTTAPEASAEDPEFISTNGFIDPVEVMSEDETPSGNLEVTLSDAVTQHRYKITRTLVWVTASLSLAVLLAALFVPQDRWGRIDGIFPLVLAPFQTLLGAAVGWYYGGRSSKD